MKFNINDENQIFDKWEQQYGDKIVRDGVVSEKDYNSPANKKIVFILKEVNSPQGGGWDLRDILKEGKETHTWSTIARWVHGITNIDQEFDWKDGYDKVDQGYRQDELRGISVMNLKKTVGEKTADEKEIHKFALHQENKKLLMDQYKRGCPVFCVNGHFQSL